MQLHLQKPELERYINDQISAGNFASPEALVEAALTIMMNDEPQLTAEDIAGIEISRQEFERGEFIEFAEFTARMKKKFGIS